MRLFCWTPFQQPLYNPLRIDAVRSSHGLMLDCLPSLPLSFYFLRFLFLEISMQFGSPFPYVRAASLTPHVPERPFSSRV